MARPKKQGLSYFPFDVDTFEDDKLFDVQNKYGPLGEVVYFRLISWAYKGKGHYLEFQSVEKLAAILIKSIGNRWVKNKQTVIEIILYLAECNLFSSELMQNNVITSVGIQSRYLKAIERRRPQDKKYWLLSDDKGQENAPLNEVNVNHNSIDVSENSTKADESTQSKVNKSKVNQTKENESKVNQIKPKETKVNQTKENESKVNEIKPKETKENQTKENQTKENQTKENQTIQNQSTQATVEELKEVDFNILEQWNAFSQMRKAIKKPLDAYSQKIILQKLDVFSLGDIENKKKILDQSTVNSWADLYPLKENNFKPKTQKEESSYDIDEYMKKSIGLKYETNE